MIIIIIRYMIGNRIVWGSNLRRIIIIIIITIIIIIIIMITITSFTTHLVETK